MDGPSTNLVINSVTYPYPLEGATSWGQQASNWAIAVSNGLLQKSGGSFTLTADVNFGANFGLLAKHFSSRTANTATSGVFRLPNAERITWRDSTNTFDHYLTVSATDELVFDGVPVGSGGSGGGSPLVFDFTGDGTTTAFSIPGIEASTSNAYFVTLDGVDQSPSDDFIINLGAETITFTTAPFNNANILVRTYVGLGDSVEVFRQELDDGSSATTVNSTLVSYDRTAAEITAGVTPTIYTYPPGDIRRYGASILNLDNTSNIQHAIDQNAAGGARVYVPAGTFLIVQLELADGVEIYGEGFFSILKLKPAGDQFMIANANGAVYVDDVYIHDLQLDGNKANNTNGGGILGNGRRNKVQNCYIHDTVKSCIQFGVGSNGGVDTPLAGSHSISNNICENPGDANSWGAIAITHGSDCSISNNIVISTDGQMTYGIDIEPNSGNECHRNSITNNIVQGGRIYVDCALMSSYSYGNIVSDNIIDARDSYDPAQSNAAPIFIRQCQNLIITGNNTFGHDSALAGGIFCEISGLTTPLCVVDLTLANNSFNSVYSGARTGYLNKIQGASITGNSWTINGSGNAVEVTNATACRFSNNRLVNAGAGRALNTSGTCTDGYFDLTNYTVGTVTNGGTGFTIESMSTFLTQTSTPTLTNTWTFTSGSNSFNGTTDNLVFMKSTSAGTDLKNWALRCGNGRFTINSLSDNLSNVRSALEINKTSTYAITSMVYGNSTDNPPHVFNGQIRQASTSGVAIIVGSGSPEGVVTAPVGSLFQRSDGGANTSLYVKESGTGNTGWIGK